MSKRTSARGWQRAEEIGRAVRWRLARAAVIGYTHAMAAADSDDDLRTYSVVVNDEEQYSIWLADRELPAGWRAVGKTGPKADCLQYIEEVWTDMRPLSLRRWMDAQAAEDGPPPRRNGL